MTVPDFPSTNACFKTPHPQLPLNNNPPPPLTIYVQCRIPWQRYKGEKKYESAQVTAQVPAQVAAAVEA